MQEDILRDLHETGLLEFATSVGYLQDFQAPSPRHRGTPGAYGAIAALPQHPHARAFEQAKSLASPSGSYQPLQHSQHTQQRGTPRPSVALHEQHVEARPFPTPQANHAAESAAAQASQAVQSSRLRLQQALSNANHRAAPLNSSNEGHQRSSRKSARTSVDQTAGRGGGKGLRHFSMKVCEKVESKGRTSYNEVADELVAEMSKSEETDGVQYDEKNIRRRVYDAINVLMAMDIIEKEKKEVIWKGFPDTTGASIERLKAERQHKISEIERKQAYLQELIEQHGALKQLLQRNPEKAHSQAGTALYLPFILVQAKPDATVEVKISEDMLDVQFDFYNSPFQIHDDSYVLRNMAKYRSSLAAAGPGPQTVGPSRRNSSPHVQAQSTASSNVEPMAKAAVMTHQPTPIAIIPQQYGNGGAYYQPAPVAVGLAIQ